ncbi:putative hydrolase [Caldicoprobacter guelmensis]|uniref:PHP domain-containing protein n=1 Tax=Caldicoprobacter guelmensis TaxID=1170224 RepID=UPI00195A3317|nr:PHP domain-containing protein [Caldicoprobacter guelmensis]MBM7581555.1 putative hydrolase [Caldicoprobacter guelmensis]
MEYHLIADYHTHTRYSHGKGTIEQNVIAARKKGLKRIAITDHGFRHVGIGMRIEDIDRMRREIDVLRKKYDDIEILFGIEANLTSMEGDIDIPEEYIGAFDLILMGFHKAVVPRSLKDGWKLFFKNAMCSLVPICDAEKLRHDNTMAIIRAMERYPIHTITHPGAKINIDTRLLAKHAVKHNVFLEINSSHGFMTEEYVKVAMEEGAKFVINSDAHTPENVGNMAKGIMIAQKAGVSPARILNSQDFLW